MIPPVKANEVDLQSKSLKKSQLCIKENGSTSNDGFVLTISAAKLPSLLAVESHAPVAQLDRATDF